MAYVCKYFHPARALGIDLNPLAIKFGSEHYRIPQLTFQQGDAQALPLSDASFDVLLNVESSHRYPNMNLFLSEVERILKPKGYFLFTDFRYDHEMEDLEQALNSGSFKRIYQQRINQEVVDALKKDTERREDLVRRLVPTFLEKVALNFAGAADSDTYQKILSEKYVYFLYIFQKN